MTDTASTEKQKLAYGVDPRRSEKYSLRQSRYNELGVDIARFGQLAKEQGRRLKFLDIGCAGGVAMRHIEVHEGADNIDYYGIDLRMQENTYKRERWSELREGDLTQGLPFLDTNQFDVVICEQVLEHLHELDVAIATFQRVLKPGGTLIVGVPIFPPGIHLLRRHLVPILDRILPLKKHRGHVQAFSKNSFVANLQRYSDLQVQKARGFRIISGGVLRPLENYRWFWQFNRFLGAMLPSMCIEIQVLAQKPLEEANPKKAAA